MQFTKEQTEKQGEMMKKLKEVSQYLNSTKPIEHSLNNTTLANLLSQVKYVLAGGKIDTIVKLSERLALEVELLEEVQEKPKRGRKKKTA